MTNFKNSSDSSISHFAEVNGIRIHYLEKGNGPLVISLPGWPETSLTIVVILLLKKLQKYLILQSFNFWKFIM